MRLAVKAKPGLSRPRPPRLVTAADNRRAVEITVAAVAEDGKANKAITETLAQALGLRKAEVSVKTGATSRQKVIEINGDPAVLREKVGAWLAGLR